MITIEGLTKRFGDTTVVDRLSIQVPTGSFLVLLGPSGCGKTTTLRMLAGLEQASDGRILLDELPVTDGGTELVAASERDAGLVFQSYALWPHMTARGNVEWPLKVSGWSKADRAERVDEVLSLLGVGEYSARYPSELSGGQQQRVAIARTLAPKPRFLLFDEPLSNLDAKLRQEMRVELLRLHRLSGATTVYVTHDQTEALSLASHLAVMNHGVLEQFGSPFELLSRPASPFVARFLGSPPANVLATVARGGWLRYGETDLAEAGAASQGAQVTLAYTAPTTRLRSSPGERTVPVTVLEIAPMAGQLVVTVETDLGDRMTCVETALPEEVAVGLDAHVELPALPHARFDHLAAASPAELV